MPYQDGTGPQGAGPTGRGLGPCGDGTAQRGNRIFGFGRGRRGRGYRAGMHGGVQPLKDNDALQAEKTWLENRLTLVHKALNVQESEN